MRSSTRSLTLLVLLAVLASACGSDTGVAPPVEVDDLGALDEERGVGEDAERLLVGAFSYDEMLVAAEQLEHWATELAAAIDEAEGLAGEIHRDAPELLAEFDFLLRAQAVYTGFVGDAVISQSHESFLASKDTLDEIREQLTELFRHHYGPEVAERFQNLWRTYQLALVRYAEAVGAHDESAKRQAFEQVEHAVEQLLEFFADITSDALDREELKHHLDEYTALLLDTIERQVPQPPQWFDTWREAVDTGAHVAELVAGAIAETLELEGEVRSPAAQLRAELAGRMAEAAWFVGAATRGLIAPDEEQFRAARDIVAHNTEELRETFAEYLDDDVARRFAELWRTHNELLFEYAGALAGETGEERVRALEGDLAEFAAALGELLGEALEEAIAATHVESLAEDHVRRMQAVIQAQVDALDPAPTP